MYLSSDEARSDLFLSAAVYVIGPIVLDFLFRVTQVYRLPFAPDVLSLVMPIVTTVLVPYLLIRYRKQRLSEFGFGGARGKPVVDGLLVAAPIVVAGFVSGWLSSGQIAGGAPVLTAVFDGGVLQVVIRVVELLGRTLLAVYCVVLAREAFRGEPAYLRSSAMQLGRIIGIVAAVATALLLASFVTGEFELGALLTLVLQPLGVAGAVALVIWRARNSRLTMRPVLVTPMVIFALGSFLLRASPTELVFGIWRASLLAGIGLAIGVLLESERSVWGPLALGLALALLTYLPT